MSTLVAAAKLGELADGTMKKVVMQGQEILLARVGETYYAVSNLCTHAGRPLAGGTLRGHELTCPAHGATFDVRTGSAIGAPAEAGLKRFAVSLEAGKVNLVL